MTGNPYHASDGKFSSGPSGSAIGDHQASQSEPVGPGRQPTRRHDGVQSVGTDSGGHGLNSSGGPRGAGGTFGVRLRPRVATRGLRRAAAEKAALGAKADARHYPGGDTAARVRASVTNIAPYRRKAS